MSYQLTAVQERRKKNEARANEFYEKVRRQEQELRDLQAKLGSAEKQASDLQTQKADMDNKMRLLVSNMDANNKAMGDLRSQITGKKQSIERDQGEMEKYQNEVVKLDREIGELMRKRQAP